MTEHLTIGFLPLVDACLPILAHEHGFAEEEGLALRFQRDMSWATVLDRLLYGHSDAAHLIAPLAIATTLGRGRPAQPLATPFVLGLNGNAVTMSRELAAKLAEPGKLADPVALGAALAEEARIRKAAGRRLRFGVVHRYSSHNYMLRYWLAASGVRPDEDVEIATVSPPFVADAMASGEIDGACVGEPWNSAAVARGVGAIVLATAQIWRRGVEKVLAFRAPVPDPDFMFQHREAANFPWVSQAEWLYTQLVRWDRIPFSPEDAAAAARVFRPDVYRSALAGTVAPLPGASSKVEGSLARPTAVTAQQGAMTLANNAFFDGRTFDPDDVEGYIASFE